MNENDRKWNLMWDMWMAGVAESPYAELMTYESEVNNGGHSQYFFNTANCGKDLKAQVEAILSVLPEPLRGNLKQAYEAFAAQDDICDDVNDELFDECDEVFYENEHLLIGLLEEYAGSLRL